MQFVHSASCPIPKAVVSMCQTLEKLKSGKPGFPATLGGMGADDQCPVTDDHPRFKVQSSVLTIRQAGVRVHNGSVGVKYG